MRWLLKHDVVFMSGKERSLSHEKCHEPRPAGEAGPHENNEAMRRDCPKAKMPWWDVLRRLERSVFDKYFLDQTIGF